MFDFSSYVIHSVTFYISVHVKIVLCVKLIEKDSEKGQRFLGNSVAFYSCIKCVIKCGYLCAVVANFDFV